MNFTVGERSIETLSELDYPEHGTCEDAESGQADNYSAGLLSEGDGAKAKMRSHRLHRGPLTPPQQQSRVLAQQIK